MPIQKAQHLLLENLAMRTKGEDSRISSRMAVFAGVLTKLPGTYSVKLVTSKTFEVESTNLLASSKGDASSKGSEVASSVP